MPPEPLAYAQTVCPGFLSREILQRTGKSILIAGTFNGNPAVAKLLTDHGAFWKQRFLHEIDFYRAIQASERPVRIPELFHADKNTLVMIQEHLQGEPLSNSRHPEAPADAPGFRLLLATLPALHAWFPFPDPGRESIVLDYEGRLAKHLARGFISAGDVQRVSTLLQTTRWVPEFNHGDLLLTNCLFDPNDRTIAFIDWEYAGYFVPGYDLALVYMMSLFDERQSMWVANEARRSDEDGRILFLTNLLILLAREAHTLLEVQHIEVLRERSNLIASELVSTRRMLRSVIG